MSDEAERNQATEGLPVGRDTTRPMAKNYGGQKLDKTLRDIRVGIARGPERTPGGFGQVWRYGD